jgi:hypothetical protein
VLFSNDDRLIYLALIAEGAARSGTHSRRPALRRKARQCPRRSRRD